MAGRILYHNNGNGTFTDVTERPVSAPHHGWTTSAVWFDYDNDGRLDLFVCSFVDLRLDGARLCGDNKLGKKYYCIPRVFQPHAEPSLSQQRRRHVHRGQQGHGYREGAGQGLGVVATDINNDGLMDLFVANDTVQNFLFVNRGRGKWEEIATVAEVGFSANGQARSGMGVDAADFDGDGWEDLFVANIDQEMFSLYRNNGRRDLRRCRPRQRDRPRPRGC